MVKPIIEKLMSGSLVLQIFIGILLAALLWWVSPESAASVSILGRLFVSALMAVAPVPVLVLVASAIANRRVSHTSQIRPIVAMYLVGTVAAALLAVVMSKLFPTELVLQIEGADRAAPQGIMEVLGNLLLRLVDNPLNAIMTANFIGILVWGVLLGVFLHHAAESTRQMSVDLPPSLDGRSLRRSGASTAWSSDWWPSCSVWSASGRATSPPRAPLGSIRSALAVIPNGEIVIVADAW